MRNHAGLLLAFVLGATAAAQTAATPQAPAEATVKLCKIETTGLGG
ncbi:MAG: hypothetical protein MUC36_18190 [Planctomycetes bacterium]|jgi:hypothetical protein|nr:hypothetical protein [Planctomycetota bacterium]